MHVPADRNLGHAVPEVDVQELHGIAASSRRRGAAYFMLAIMRVTDMCGRYCLYTQLRKFAALRFPRKQCLHRPFLWTEQLGQAGQLSPERMCAYGPFLPWSGRIIFRCKTVSTASVRKGAMARRRASTATLFSQQNED